MIELADAIVQVARAEMARGKWVAISTVKLDGSGICDIEHVGGGLVRYKHPGLTENDMYVPAINIQLDVRPGDWER